MPHLLRYFDHPTVVRTCITPRPLLIVAPTDDQDMPATGVSELIDEVKPAYEGCGASDAFVVCQPAGRHKLEHGCDTFSHGVELRIVIGIDAS